MATCHRITHRVQVRQEGTKEMDLNHRHPNNLQEDFTMIKVRQDRHPNHSLEQPSLVNTKLANHNQRASRIWRHRGWRITKPS